MFKNRPIDEIEKATLDCINEFDLSQTNAEGYSALRDRYNSAGDSIDLFVLTCFSFNHQIRFNGQHKFNTPFGRNRSSYNASIERNLRRFADALRSKEVEFSTKDFRELDYSILGKGDFAYFDPPYLISTGTYNDGKRGFCGWSIREERDLLSILDELNDKGVPFALSNVLYHKGMVNELLVEWADSYRVHYVGNSFANCSYHNKYRTSETVEVLITNY